MTMTNAQAALMATTTWFSDTPHLVTETALHTAELFKNWLDQQDAKDLADFDKGRYLSTSRDYPLPSSAGHPEQHDPKKHISTNPGLWGRIT